jgi:hypothetical protein
MVWFREACIRCPMLRVDPQQRPRLIAIIRNLGDRITEARMNGWLGEVEGLPVSLDAARAKLTSLDRATSAPTTSVTSLGIPVIRGSRREPCAVERFQVHPSRYLRSHAIAVTFPDATVS